MAEIEHPQIYLISPPEVELSRFPKLLGECLDAVPVACFRLALSTQDEDKLSKIADACREVCHARDVAIVIDSHVQLAERLGLDGVHLTDGSRSVRKVRKDLGKEAIVGTYCAQSRHDGMSAGEAEADYVSFGPVAATALGDGAYAEADLFQWWSEMIEVPVVAEGALDEAEVRALRPFVDFFGISEIWAADDPSEALKSLAAQFS
ncbi:MAG: thiamine phosphate synthase [Rhodobacteraceae bacterium]|nr:thiamine phosphate synthase [Paracoccaceae bacterium]